jgi:fucokinase
MGQASESWDYLVVTASNDAQASEYDRQLRLRRRLGLLSDVGEVLVVADPGGRRVGSGGSTIVCLAEILDRELACDGADRTDPAAWELALRRLRILIVHAGGDSRRLPAYGPCGKSFIPVPGESDSALAATLFDRQIPTYLALPPGEPGAGQVVITAGDVLLTFDPQAARFAAEGMTGLGCQASPERASRHGVYCAEPDGQVRLYLQKPAAEQQAEAGAVDRYGQSILDIGVIQFDAATAVALLKIAEVRPQDGGQLAWSGEMGQAVEQWGLDFYREICCAMGAEATCAQYIASARSSGSPWDDALLGRLLQSLSAIPFHVRVLPQCNFLHFGMTRHVIASGLDLLRADRGLSELHTCLCVNDQIADQGSVVGDNAWVEGCRIRAALSMAGENVVVGLDLDEPLSIPRGACLDLTPGAARDGRDAWFVKCYGVADNFKDTLEQGATLCGLPVEQWLHAIGAGAEDVWDAAVPPEQRTVWDARLFPAVREQAEHLQWLWFFDPGGASGAQTEAWRAADRYSLAEIAERADPEAFHARRRQIRAEEIRQSLRRMFRRDSGFSAGELACAIADARDRAAWVAALLDEARWHYGPNHSSHEMGGFVFSRIIHTLGSALERLATGDRDTLLDVVPGLDQAMDSAARTWLESLDLAFDAETPARQWAERARSAAFEHLGRVIVASGSRLPAPPRNGLRPDEIVWGRAPARLDLGGGWSDTPPYSLEYGGCVLNAAVNLNGQPPIHCYARTVDEPVIRVASIDLGARIEITCLDDLLDYRSATSEFALAKAAFALSGFSPEAAAWPDGADLSEMLEHFGGGIELTTLAAIPKGSGLGTSSIVGAVVLAVVNRVMGRTFTQRELFQGVLRLEQALTTGGGWQDQVGGVVDGVKVATAEPGIRPAPSIHYVPADVLDPVANGGSTLLYYTGITRLAKNILRNVVGRYLDRDRAAMATLRRIHALPPRVADAMARKDAAAFGELVAAAWRLNKQLDPDSSNDRIEALLDRIAPHAHGAKLLGAGGGGFLLVVCKSPADAAVVREMLDADPPNDRARFFDFEINREGLVVTVC